MAKGDDAVRRKRNKINRKRMSNSESAVSARVASIIVAKRRRKAGKRRICEGMCYSLPTAEDPFNDSHGKKELPKKKKKPPPPPPPPKKKKKKKKQRKENNPPSLNPDKEAQAGSSATVAVATVKIGPKSGGDDYGCPSKFLILCLNAIQDAWLLCLFDQFLLETLFSLFFFSDLSYICFVVIWMIQCTLVFRTHVFLSYLRSGKINLQATQGSGDTHSKLAPWRPC